MSKTSTAIDRRTFVTGAGLALGAAALVGASGCSSTTSTTDSQTSEGEATASQYETSETLTCDLVVVGGGISGLSCAVEGAQEGANVILVEKQGEVGGNSLGAEGPFAVNSVMQQEANIDLPLYSALKNELQFSNYRASSSLWIKFLEDSGENISWLLDNGVKFVDVRTCNAGLQGWHYYDGGGKAAVSAMLSTAESLGVQIMTLTPMVELAVDDAGTICGIIAEHEDGYIRIEAKAVVLASGGTGANGELATQYTGFDCSRANIGCNPGNTGDGLTQAVAHGAATRTACIMGDKCVSGYDLFANVTFAATRQPILWVNGNGERFVDEGIVREDIPSAFNAVFLSQDSCYSITDQATVDSFAEGGCPDALSNYFPDQGDKLPELKEQIEEVVSAADGRAFSGETVEELAEQMGADPTVLAETIDRYNEQCAQKEDKDFFKKAEYLIPVETGPFYAFKMDPQITCAIGGLVTDTENHVLDADGNPIPNLYAVGLDGCALYEETYNMALSGSCNGYCIFSGRNAARNALATA